MDSLPFLGWAWGRGQVGGQSGLQWPGKALVSAELNQWCSVGVGVGLGVWAVGAQGWRAKRAQGSTQFLSICKQLWKHICKLVAALRVWAGSPTIPWVLVPGHLSFIAFGRQLDWSRLWTLLMRVHYFLLDSSPPLLVEKICSG